ncbi:MAG: dephospho-CoA kinase [Cyanobacteria bacterium J06639_1]
MSSSPICRVIGVTGGIGTGKSTVAEVLQEMGVVIADADRLARDAVASGSPVLAAIRDRFGAEVFTTEEALNRRALGDIIFTHPEERQWLETQIHPYVRQKLVEFARDRENTEAIALVVPLLFEAGMTDLVSEVWVVTCSPERQRERLRQRDGLTDEAIAARIASQWPLSDKVKRADVVIENDGDLDELRSRVDRALRSRAIPVESVERPRQRSQIENRLKTNGEGYD